MAKKKEIKGWGVASLVTGILSLVTVFVPYIGLPLAILAVIFSYKQNKLNVTGNAVAGKVLGILGIIINGIICLIMLFFLLLIL